jgi:GDP-4-dehydro-6-deoxy-D-mannose reductase
VYVGNLSAARDFTDVRDVVRAYTLLLNKGRSGGVYHVCSGKAYTMQTILDMLVGLSKVPIEVRVSPDRYRVVDIPVMLGDARRLRQDTGWQPQIPIEQSLRDTLDEWRLRAGVPITHTP